jgi:hypothetical protein
MWTGEDWLLPGDPPAELEEVGSVSVTPEDPPGIGPGRRAGIR